MSRVSLGTVLNGFRIRQAFHAGAMAEIFDVDYADGTPIPFPLVMKLPRIGAGDGRENLTSFEVEHQILPSLTGPHVPRFVAAGDMAETPYLVMEKIAGTPLDAWTETVFAYVDADKQVAKAAELMAAVADAVHSLHQQNVCHLDLKPENLIRQPTGNIVLIDFGLSYHGDYPDLLAEEFRKAVGSPTWIAPEQVVGVRGDPRSDLFAIGVMLYALLTGTPPFGAPITQGGLRQRLWMTPKPPKARRPDLPAWMQEIILKCLEPQADKRFPSAAHLAFALRNPDKVALSARSSSVMGASGWTHFKRWIQAAGRAYEPSPLPKRQIQEVPLVMVCLPHKDVQDSTLWGLKLAASRALGNRPGARLAVVMVLRPSETSHLDRSQSETTLHRNFVGQMQAWSQGLDLTEHQLSFHVLENDDVAAAILAYAEHNHVSLIILGAATHGLRMQRFVATVPIRVAMDAPCTVTLVKEPLPFQRLQSAKALVSKPNKV